MNALIGHTGFIGGILVNHHPNWDQYNSKNISEISNKTYDTVYCCGIQSKKWWANKNIELDWLQIDNLLMHMKSIVCNKCVLVSTIAIYDDEPYGKHRLKAEEILTKMMGDKLHIIRLPSLFGEGLVKNILYDLINNSLRGPLNLDDEIQWYNVDNIEVDIQYMVNENIKLLEVYPEPLSNRVLMSLVNREINSGVHEGGSSIDVIKPANGYYSNQNTVINDLKKYINGYM